MNETKSLKRTGCGCCMMVLLFAIILMAPSALAPYLREERPVTVVITDEANHPIANAAIHIHEFEWIHFIPLLTFASPSHLVERRRTVTTDSHGKAQFTVKLERTVANRISHGGQTLRVVSYQITDTFNGRRSPATVPLRSDFSIEWGAIGGVSNLSYETNIVVTTNPPK